MTAPSTESDPEESGGWWLWPAVGAVVGLDVLVRQAGLPLWSHLLVLVGAVLLLNRLGVGGWVWRTLTVALLLSTVVAEWTTWGLWPIRLVSVPAAWVLCMAAAIARQVFREAVITPAAEGWLQAEAEHEAEEPEE